MKKKLRISFLVLFIALLLVATAGCGTAKMSGKRYEYDSCSCAWAEETTTEEKVKTLNNIMTEKQMFNTLAGKLQQFLATMEVDFVDEENLKLVMPGYTSEYIYMKEGDSINFVEDDNQATSFKLNHGKLIWIVSAKEIGEPFKGPFVFTIVLSEIK